MSNGSVQEGMGGVVRGTGTADDPKVIQEVFNVNAWSFGKDAATYSQTISSAVNSFNNQGTHKVGKEYFKLEFVCNIFTTPDEYATGHTFDATLIIGNDRYIVSEKDETKGSPVLGGERDNSGVVGYYKTIEDKIGSGAAAQEAMKKVIIHEIGHSFGLEENQFPMMGGFNTDTGASPGSIDSGAIVKMIDNNPGKN